MNSPAPCTAPGTPVLGGARPLRFPAVVTLAVAGALAPLGYWQYGGSGLAVIAVGTVTIVLSFAAADWVVKLLMRRGATAFGVLAAAGLRMLLPLTLVLLLGLTQLVPARAVIYLVPLYLAMLCSDTLLAARQLADNRRQADVG